MSDRTSLATCKAATAFGDGMYNSISDLSKNHDIMGRFLVIPAVGLRCAIFLLTPALVTIERIALAAFNLIGAAFFEKCTLKASFVHLGSAIITPFSYLVIPFLIPRIAFTTIIGGLIDPTTLNKIVITLE